MGEETRLCLNPNPDCNSNCSFCARTYPQRRQLKDLPAATIPPADVLMDAIVNDEFVTKDKSLADIEEISLVTGDFPRNTYISEADYLLAILNKAKRHGFHGKWYYAGHQICQDSEFEQLQALGLSGTYAYTLEVFTRRQQLMPVKGRAPLDAIYGLLDSTGKKLPTSEIAYYYISSLDDPELTKQQINRFWPVAVPHVSVFSPYAYEQYNLAHKFMSVYDELTNIIDLQKFILNMNGSPIPSGSNRGLFSPRCKYENGKLQF